MELFQPMGRMLNLILGVLLFLLISYALPREVIRGRLQKRYREAILVTGSYWERSFDKWIVKGRIYYTDEMKNDVFCCALWGIVGNFVGIHAFAALTSKELVEFLLIPAIPATTLLLYSFIQIDRVHVIDEELSLRRAMDPQFDESLELRKLVVRDRRFVKRVIFSEIST